MGKERIDKELLLKVGVRLREIRKEYGFPQEKVEFDTRVAVAKYERGEHNLSLTTLSILCKYYDISLEAFFRGIKN